MPETIYQAIYVQGRGGLRRELHRALRTGRAMRRPRRGATALPSGSWINKPDDTEEAPQ